MTQAHNHTDTAAAILKSSMTHVPFDGWSEVALLAGARDAGFDAETMHAAFPRGAIDAIVLHSRLVDQNMVTAFAALPERPAKVHLMVRALILLRLKSPSQTRKRYAALWPFWPCQCTLLFRSSCCMKLSIQCGGPPGRPIPILISTPSARHWLQCIVPRCWHGWLTIAAGLKILLAFGPAIIRRRAGAQIGAAVSGLGGLGKRVARGLASGVSARRSDH